MRALAALLAMFLTPVAFAQAPVGLQPVYVGPVGLESPTVDADGNVYFSNLGAGGISKLDAQGRVTQVRDVRSNGLVLDPQGRLIVVERDPPGTSRLTRIDVKTGATEVLADSYEGKPLNDLNDVTFDGAGRIWFTNDTAGELGGVYRIDPGGKLVRVLGPADVQYPNGLIVSPDDRTLYVIETNGLPDGHRRVTAFALSPDGQASQGRLFHDFHPGRSGDGMTVDSAGNLWVLAGLNKLRATVNGQPSSETLDTMAGLYQFAPDGRQLAFYPITDDLVTNAAFGGPGLRTLYVTGGKTLFKLAAPVAGTRR